MNVFYHEYSHITLQHLEIGKRNIAEFFFEYDKLSEFTRKRLQERKIFEYEADLQAGTYIAYWLNESILTNIKEKESNDLDIKELIQFLFSFYILGAFLVFNVAKTNYSDSMEFTHPSLQERITAFVSGLFIAIRDKSYKNFNILEHITIPELQSTLQKVTNYIYAVAPEMSWTIDRFDNDRVSRFHHEYISDIIKLRSQYGIMKT